MTDPFRPNHPLSFGRLRHGLIFAGLLVMSSMARSIAAVPDAAAIQADYEMTIADITAQSRDNFPGGSAADATSVAEVEAHLRRLEVWRQTQLVSYEKTIKRFEDLGKAFDVETERLKRNGQLTVAQAEERAQQYREFKALVSRTGPLMTGYVKWLRALLEAVHEWKKRGVVLASSRD